MFPSLKAARECWLAYERRTLGICSATFDVCLDGTATITVTAAFGRGHWVCHNAADVALAVDAAYAVRTFKNYKHKPRSQRTKRPVVTVPFKTWLASQPSPRREPTVGKIQRYHKLMGAGSVYEDGHIAFIKGRRR